MNHNPYKCIYAKELKDIAEVKRILNLDDTHTNNLIRTDIDIDKSIRDAPFHLQSFQEFLCHNKHEDLESWLKHICFHLFHLPRRISNLCHNINNYPDHINKKKQLKLPSWAISEEYFIRLLYNLAYLMMNNLKASKAAKIAFVEIIVKLIQTSSHSFDIVAKVLYNSYVYKFKHKFNSIRMIDFDLIEVIQTMRERVGAKNVAQVIKYCMLYCLCSSSSSAKAIDIDIDMKTKKKVLWCYKFIHAMFFSVVSTDSELREELTQCIVLSSRGASSLIPLSYSKAMILIVVSLYIACCSKSKGEDRNCVTVIVVLDELMRVAQYWCENSFVQHSAAIVHRNSTEFILKCLLYISKFREGIDSNDFSLYQEDERLVPILVKGVSCRLDATDPEVRRDGIRVAEQFAPLVGQTNIRFDELDGYREEEPIAFSSNSTIFLCGDDDNDDDKEESSSYISEQSADNFSSINDGVTQSKVLNEKEKRQRIHRRQPLASIDPDEEYESFSEDDESAENRDSDVLSSSSTDASFDEDDLRSLMDDDDFEDLREIPKPLYLRECLTLLRCPENDEHADSKIESALQSLQGLVESCPPDLHDLCVPIAKQLVYIENKFNLPNFNELRINSMVAIVVKEPLTTTEYLSVCLFDSGTIRARTEILDVLTNAAEILCGTQTLTQRRRQLISKSSLLTEDLSTRIAGKRHLVKEEGCFNPSNSGPHSGSDEILTYDNTKTRRWGYRRDGGLEPVKNRFAPHAHVFFYLLLSGFVRSKEDSSVWDNAGHVLTRFLYSLSVFVECSGNAPSTQMLAVELFSFAWSFHMTDHENVRQALLYTLAVCIDFVPHDFVYRFASENQLFVNYLAHCVSADPNKGCRELASVVTSNIQKSLYLLESL